MKHTHGKRGGFTLVELVVAFTVLSIILGAVGAVSLAGRDAYQKGVQSATLEARARRALERIATELTAGVDASVTPNPNTPMGISTIQFRTCTGFAAGAQQLSTPTIIRLESDPDDANDGIDNDTDGLIDERQIALVRNVGMADEISTVLVTHVSEFLAGETANMADDNGNGLIDEAGFSIVADGTATLRLRLSLACRDPKNNLVTRTVETSVHLRN